jgi:hypothetical protein
LQRTLGRWTDITAFSRSHPSVSIQWR